MQGFFFFFNLNYYTVINRIFSYLLVVDAPTLKRSRFFNMAAAGSFAPLFLCFLHPTMAAIT